MEQDIKIEIELNLWTYP